MHMQGKKKVKVVEIVQVSPGTHLIVRLRGQCLIRLTTNSWAKALAAADRIGQSFQRYGIGYRVSY